MPLDQGRYILKVGEIFEVPLGLSQIENDLKHSRKARLNNLPTPLAAKLLPMTAGYKTVEVGMHDEAQLRDLRALAGGSKVVKSHWYQTFLGDRLNMGEVLTPTALYQILWTKDQIRRIFAVTDPNYLEFVWKKNLMMRMEDEQVYATVYDRAEGLDVIKSKAERAEVFRACVIPPPLLRELLPTALKADYRIITSRKDPLVAHFKADAEVRSGSDAKIFFVYGGEESNVGSLRLNHELFWIIWKGDKIFNVQRFDNLVFANFLSRVFDTAWKFSKKLV
jgi:hypothetical protein